MRVLMLAATAIATLSGVAPASAEPGSSALAYPPPFVDRVLWAQGPQRNQLSSLRVYPTAAGRAAAEGLGSSSPEADEAWSEVLAQAPQAGTPGMRQQFLCHWDFAEVAQPGKVSWNLEPWRPVVDDATMVSSGCNPGGREPF
jgi:hypothetical protein